MTVFFVIASIVVGIVIYTFYRFPALSPWISLVAPATLFGGAITYLLEQPIAVLPLSLYVGAIIVLINSLGVTRTMLGATPLWMHALIVFSYLLLPVVFWSLLEGRTLEIFVIISVVTFLSLIGVVQLNVKLRRR